MREQILLGITYDKKILRTEEPPLLGYESEKIVYRFPTKGATISLVESHHLHLYF
jgi:hypothetical protein